MEGTVPIGNQRKIDKFCRGTKLVSDCPLLRIWCFPISLLDNIVIVGAVDSENRNFVGGGPIFKLIFMMSKIIFVRGRWHF